MIFIRHVKCIQKLLENKANIEISNSDGMTPVSTDLSFSLVISLFSVYSCMSIYYFNI